MKMLLWNGVRRLGNASNPSEWSLPTKSSKEEIINFRRTRYYVSRTGFPWISISELSLFSFLLRKHHFGFPQVFLNHISWPFFIFSPLLALSATSLVFIYSSLISSDMFDKKSSLLHFSHSTFHQLFFLLLFSTLALYYLVHPLTHPFTCLLFSNHLLNLFYFPLLKPYSIARLRISTSPPPGSG